MSNEDKAVLVIAGLLLLVGSMSYLVGVTSAHHPQPQPTPTPVVYVVDSGFHKGLDSHGAVYQIDARYDQMNDIQKDDVNRFGRLYPEGQ